MARAGSAVGIMDVRTIAIAEDIKFALNINLALCVGRKLRYYSAGLFGERGQNSYIIEDGNYYDGFSGWIQAFSAAMICGVVFGTLHSLVLLHRYFQLSLDIGEVELVVIASGKYAIILLLSPLSGQIIKLIGNRYACTIGLLFVALQFFLDSLITEVGPFYVTQWILGGIGYSLAFSAASSCVIDRFRKETSLGLLPVIIASSVGTILILTFLYFMRHGSNLNNRWILVILGFLMLLCITLTRSLPIKKNLTQQHPSPFIKTNISTSAKIEQCLESQDLSPPKDPCKPEGSEEKACLCICVTDIGIIFSLVFILWSFISFASMLTVYIPYLFLIWLAIDEFNVSSGDAMLLLLLFCVASTFSRILWTLMDYTTFKANRNLFVIGLIGNGVLYMFLPAADTHGWLIVWSVTIGIIEGILVITTPRLTLRTCPRENVVCAWSFIVVSHGVALFIGGLIWAITRKLSGGDIFLACMILGVTQIIAAVLSFLLPDEEEEFAQRNGDNQLQLQNPQQPFPGPIGGVPGGSPNSFFPMPLATAPFPDSSSGCNDCIGSGGYPTVYSGNQNFSTFGKSSYQDSFKFSSSFVHEHTEPVCNICENMLKKTEAGNFCSDTDGCGGMNKMQVNLSEGKSRFEEYNFQSSDQKYNQIAKNRSDSQKPLYMNMALISNNKPNYLIPTIESDPTISPRIQNPHLSKPSRKNISNSSKPGNMFISNGSGMERDSTSNVMIPNVVSDPTVGGSKYATHNKKSAKTRGNTTSNNLTVSNRLNDQSYGSNPNSTSSDNLSEPTTKSPPYQLGGSYPEISSGSDFVDSDNAAIRSEKEKLSQKGKPNTFQASSISSLDENFKNSKPDSQGKKTKLEPKSWNSQKAGSDKQVSSTEGITLYPDPNKKIDTSDTDDMAIPKPRRKSVFPNENPRALTIKQTPSQRAKIFQNQNISFDNDSDEIRRKISEDPLLNASQRKKPEPSGPKSKIDKEKQHEAIFSHQNINFTDSDNSILIQDEEMKSARSKKRKKVSIKESSAHLDTAPNNNEPPQRSGRSISRNPSVRSNSSILTYDHFGTLKREDI